MTRRILLALAAVASSAGCGAELGQYGVMREKLDEYVIAKPLAQAWPEALRFLNARDYPPVGADRERIGLPPMGSWGTVASQGRETQISGHRWTADTQTDARGRRYRLIGVELSATTSRIGFFMVSDRGGPVPSSDDRSREEVTRDPSLEIAFIATLDPQRAAELRPKDPGFF